MRWAESGLEEGALPGRRRETGERTREDAGELTGEDTGVRVRTLTHSMLNALLS